MIKNAKPADIYEKKEAEKEEPEKAEPEKTEEAND